MGVVGKTTKCTTLKMPTPDMENIDFLNPVSEKVAEVCGASENELIPSKEYIKLYKIFVAIAGSLEFQLGISEMNNPETAAVQIDIENLKSIHEDIISLINDDQ